ncbi:hypothetical protein LCGC14_0739100 [marine sediment metagenome]|uniref:Uncharacterized protein n=1 Tax=marine sediment metagenome TaxID=412755 RepID=A0A0F9TEI7_9ZZZZ
MLKGGFYHHHTKEELIEYKKLSPTQKLDWLEEINSFLYKNVSKQKRDLWTKFRKGEI